jgi:hypothetical protein
MDYVTAKIALGGDPLNVMWRSRENPIAWSEVPILQHLHGEASVYDCDFVRSEPGNNPQTEKNRLIGIYGAEAVNLVYPGARPLIDGAFPGDKVEEGQKRPEKRPAPTHEIVDHKAKKHEV